MSLRASSTMATTNKLDASGLLYEGSNFAKWRDAQRSILAQHFPGASWSKYWGHHSVPDSHSSDACDCILWHVSSHVSSRVPEEDRKNLRRLLCALSATARPFRFMDLPAELRLRVYKIVLATKTSQRTLTILGCRPGQYPPAFEYSGASLVEPQILATSHQIRVEALPLHYRDDIELMFTGRFLHRWVIDNTRWPRPKNTERVCAINGWAATIKPDSMRLLRKISVQLPLLAVCSSRGCEDMLRFSLSVSNGKPEVHVEPHAWLKPASQELLRNHVSVISNLANVLKLEGEALIMVLMSRPDIWDQLELAKK